GLAVLFVDLDRFKAINDTLGHWVGDELLRLAAARLRDCVREDDLVARVGGDEFGVLLPRVRQEGAIRIAGKILGRLRQPFGVDGHQLHASASVGAAVYPVDGRSAEALLKSADGAMYRAKQSGRDTVRFLRSSG